MQNFWGTQALLRIGVCKHWPFHCWVSITIFWQISEIHLIGTCPGETVHKNAHERVWRSQTAQQEAKCPTVWPARTVATIFTDISVIWAPVRCIQWSIHCNNFCPADCHLHYSPVFIYSARRWSVCSVRISHVKQWHAGCSNVWKTVTGCRMTWSNDPNASYTASWTCHLTWGILIDITLRGRAA